MLSLMCEMSNDGNVNKKEKEEKKGCTYEKNRLVARQVVVVATGGVLATL